MGNGSPGDLLKALEHGKQVSTLSRVILVAQIVIFTGNK